MRIEGGTIGVTYEYIHPTSGQWVKANPTWRGTVLDLAWKSAVEEVDEMMQRQDRRNIRIMFRPIGEAVEVTTLEDVQYMITSSYDSGDAIYEQVSMDLYRKIPATRVAGGDDD